MAHDASDRKLAVYCDFENIALGVRDARYQKFNIDHILERLLVKGSIVVKKAYCDWERYREFKAAMHEAAFELIDIPHVRQSGKNSADIRLVVDALDLCYTKAHVDTFVIISGDSDFSPLVSKLRENAHTVIGVGVKQSTSDLLIGNCDEFIFYDDLVRELERKRPSRSKKNSSRKNARSGKAETEGKGETEGDSSAAVETSDKPGKGDGTKTASRKSTSKQTAARKKSAAGAEHANSRDSSEVELPVADVAAVADETEEFIARRTEEELVQEGIELMLETASTLYADREGSDKLWGSMIKQALKRRRPGFNESYYGFSSFGKMLEEAAARGYLDIALDDRSGGYIIQGIHL